METSNVRAKIVDQIQHVMQRIEAGLATYSGYLVLLIDEVDNVRRDRDAFMTFMVRRLPQRIKAKPILVFTSNRLDWPTHLNPRVKSFPQAQRVDLRAL